VSLDALPWDESLIRPSSGTTLRNRLQWFELIDHPGTPVEWTVPGMSRWFELEPFEPVCLACPSSELTFRWGANASTIETPDREIRVRHGIGCVPAPGARPRGRVEYVGMKEFEVTAGGGWQDVKGFEDEMVLPIVTSGEGARGWVEYPFEYYATAIGLGAFNFRVVERLFGTVSIPISTVSSTAAGTRNAARLSMQRVLQLGVLQVERPSAPDLTVQVRLYRRFQ